MKYEFEVYQMKVEDHLFWVAKSKILKGVLFLFLNHVNPKRKRNSYERR